MIERLNNILFELVFDRRVPRGLVDQIGADLMSLLRFISRYDRPFYFSKTIDYLDECWHQIILDTKFYHDLCSFNFGTFIHHEPFKDSGKNSFKGTDCSSVIINQKSDLERALGPAFVKRIYFLYPVLLKRFGVLQDDSM